MLKSILCFMMLSQLAGVDTFKREMASLQEVVDTAILSTGARIMHNAKVTYLEGFGIVANIEVALEQPPNPFTRVKTEKEIRTIVTQRRLDITAKLSELLKQRVSGIGSLAATDSMAIVVYLLNGTPAETPDLPIQLVVTVQKADPTKVKVREY